MNTREHYELFRYLAEQLCLLQEDLLFVEDIADWCKEQGIPESDRERPMKIVSKDVPGCRMLIKEYISDEVMHERIRALRVRSQLQNVASDRADALGSDRKKLAYLFLSEYALSLPDVQDDFLADDWAFDQMNKFGFFKK